MTDRTNQPDCSTLEIEARFKRALGELEDTIRRQYPDAAFDSFRAYDRDGTPEAYLVATTNCADFDDVIDLVLDRTMDMLIDEGLSVHVLPRQSVGVE